MKNEEEVVKVKASFELYGNYCFRIEEINKILKGKSIYHVLANSICIVVEEIPNIEKIPDEKDLEEDLKENKQKVIEYINLCKERLDINENSYMLKELDRIESIIEKLEEIVSKYEGKFNPSQDKKSNNRYNANTYIGKLNNNSDFKFEISMHEAIIDEELFNKVKKKIEAEDVNEEI